MLFLDEQSVRDVERDVQRWAALWPADGLGPEGTIGLDRALAAGIAAYDRTDMLALRITDGIEASGGRVVYDLESARAIERMTNAWLVPAARAAERIAASERDGATVPHAAEFLDRVIDARLGTSISVEEAAESNERFAREYPGAIGFPPQEYHGGSRR